MCAGPAAFTASSSQWVSDMTDRKKIIATFEAIEAERGGYAYASADDVCKCVAEKLEEPIEEVKDVMRAHWAKVGGV